MQRLHPSMRALRRVGLAWLGAHTCSDSSPLRTAQERQQSPGKEARQAGAKQSLAAGVLGSSDHGELSGEEGARRGAWSRSMLGGRVLSRQGMEARAHCGGT